MSAGIPVEKNRKFRVVYGLRRYNWVGGLFPVCLGSLPHDFATLLAPWAARTPTAHHYEFFFYLTAVGNDDTWVGFHAPGLICSFAPESDAGKKDSVASALNLVPGRVAVVSCVAPKTRPGQYWTVNGNNLYAQDDIQQPGPDGELHDPPTIDGTGADADPIIRPNRDYQYCSRTGELSEEVMGELWDNFQPRPFDRFFDGVAYNLFSDNCYHLAEGLIEQCGRLVKDQWFTFEQWNP